MYDDCYDKIVGKKFLIYYKKIYKFNSFILNLSTKLIMGMKEIIYILHLEKKAYSFKFDFSSSS